MAKWAGHSWRSKAHHIACKMLEKQCPVMTFLCQALQRGPRHADSSCLSPSGCIYTTSLLGNIQLPNPPESSKPSRLLTSISIKTSPINTQTPPPGVCADRALASTSATRVEISSHLPPKQPHRIRPATASLRSWDESSSSLCHPEKKNK